MTILIGYLVRLLLFSTGLIGIIWSTYEIVFAICDNTIHHSWEGKDVGLIICLILFFLASIALFIFSFYSPVY